jgi:hypothetical protein
MTQHIRTGCHGSYGFSGTSGFGFGLASFTLTVTATVRFDTKKVVRCAREASYSNRHDTRHHSTIMINSESDVSGCDAVTYFALWRRRHHDSFLFSRRMSETEEHLAGHKNCNVPGKLSPCQFYALNERRKRDEAKDPRNPTKYTAAPR